MVCTISMHFFSKLQGHQLVWEIEPALLPQSDPPHAHHSPPHHRVSRRYHLSAPSPRYICRVLLESFSLATRNHLVAIFRSLPLNGLQVRVLLEICVMYMYHRLRRYPRYLL